MKITSMIWASSWFALVLSTSAINAFPRASAKRNSRLDGIVKSHKLPGLAALAVTSSGAPKTAAGGVRKSGNATPLTTNDKFHLGSNSKAMTATLLAMIIQNGNGSLTWNSTLQTALPGIENMSAAFSTTTLAMVGAHRSGISTDLPERNLTLALRVFQPGFDAVEGRNLIARQFLTSPPEVTPNTAFHYSNINYILLGYIIDTLGIPWEERIKIDLWSPLGMNECGFGPPPSSNDMIENPWPHQYTALGPVPISPSSQIPPSDNPPTYGPAGTIHCSMNSYSKFLSFHLRGLREEATTLLSSSSFHVLHDTFPYSKEGNAVEFYTSGGWARDSAERFGGEFLIHTGSNTLNYAVALLAPNKDVAIAAFTNVGGDEALAGCLEVVNGWFAGNVKLEDETVGENKTASKSMASQ